MILSRYIIKTMILSTLVASLVIGSLLLLLSLLGELKTIGEGDYDFWQGLYYVLMRLPSSLYQFSPMIMLLGSIIGLSILSTHRELAIMRTSGYALRSIIYNVFSACLLLIFFLIVMGELAAPELSYKAEINKENAKNAGQAVVTTSGVWLHIDNNFIHVEQVISRQLYGNVTRYQYDRDYHLRAAFFAKTLSFKNNRWEMRDVVKTSFFPDHTTSQFFKTAEWKLKFNPNLLTVGLVEPNEMSLSKLSRFTNYLKQNGLQATEYQYEFWQRVFQPLASLIMILLAMPFVLGTRSTTTTGRRILLGIVAGFMFVILNSFLGQLCIVYQLPAIVAALMPMVLFALVGGWLSNKMLRH